MIIGIMKGQRVMTLVYDGATHNFIDVSLVTRRNIPVEYFEVFNVVVEDGYKMTYTKRIMGLEVTLGNYTLINEFYIMDLADIHVVLGVEWLYPLGDIQMNYKDMRMEFQDNYGQQVVLRGMSTSAPRIVSNQHMKSLFRHGDVAYTTKCLITMEKPSEECQHYLVEIQALFGKHERVFEPLPTRRPSDRGFEHVIELEEGLKPVITTPY
jgi:hypothetical protein